VRPAQAVVADWVKLLGASTVNVSAPEAREALERGVADAITFPWESVYLFGINKVTRFHIDARMHLDPAPEVGFETVLSVCRATEYSSRGGQSWQNARPRTHGGGDHAISSNRETCYSMRRCGHGDRRSRALGRSLVE